jgi:hypothetical protein
LARWLVAGALPPVTASVSAAVLEDEERAGLRAEVRDKAYRPVADARVEAHVVTPGGAGSTVELNPLPGQQGVYGAEWTAVTAGSYVAEAVAYRGEEELGRHAVTFRRENGVAENFHTSQNRELLARLSGETGGRYYRPSEAAALAGEISYSEAGIVTRETKELWNMPALFALLAGLRAAEWLLRRRW